MTNTEKMTKMKIKNKKKGQKKKRKLKDYSKKD